MDLWRTVLVLVRRWYLALPAFLVSVGIAAAVYTNVPVRYTSTAVLLLTTPTTGASTPKEPGTTNPLTNPLLNFDGGLNTSASILIQSMSTPEMVAEMGVTPDSDTTFTVNSGSTNPELLTSGPFVFVQGESGSPEAARAIVTKVMERAEAELAARQRNLDAPEPTYINTTEIVPPTTPTSAGGSRLRAAAAAAVLGIMASLTAAFGGESIAHARRRARAARSAAGGAGGSLDSRPSGEHPVRV